MGNDMNNDAKLQRVASAFKACSEQQAGPIHEYKYDIRTGYADLAREALKDVKSGVLSQPSSMSDGNIVSGLKEKRDELEMEGKIKGRLTECVGHNTPTGVTERIAAYFTRTAGPKF